MIFNRRIIAAIQLVVAAAICSPVGSAQAQTPLFEVENDSLKLLQVNNDGGFVLFGTDGGQIPVQGQGARFMWHPGKYAVRAGWTAGPDWDEGLIGHNTVAIGKDVRASATYSSAFGKETQAQGYAAFAAGEKSIAHGNNSLAIGEGTFASQTGAVALGVMTSAEGHAAFAAGENTRASGQRSVALGYGAVAQGSGSFIFGDMNTSYQRPAQTNQFVVRAFGGILLNTGAFIGCELAPGSGTWSCASSRTVKEGFEDTDGEEILRKVAGLSIKRWRYIGSEAEHIGPIAEEFRQAFGLGTDSTKIDGVDADGIALRAIQALEKRTAALQEAVTALQAANVALEADNVAVRSELVAMRARMSAMAQQNKWTPPDTDGAR
jgi:autotransporter adhesin